MPCFFKDDQGTQRRTCRVLTVFCLAALAPFVLFVFIAATGSGSTTEEDGQAEATTGDSNHSASRIPLVAVTLLWVVVALWSRRVNTVTRQARCPAWTQRFGEWPDFCQLVAPAMFVLCICFFISAVSGDDSVPVGSHGLLPVSMIPLFVASALGCCAGCCACYGGVRNNWHGWASSSEAARAAGCVLWIVSGFFTWFMILLGIKVKYLDPDLLPGQAGRVQTGYPYFSVFFPTFLIDVLVFPCAVGFFNRKYYLACHSSNAMEAEKHAAKCTVAGLFSVLWLSSIFVRFLFIFDEANLNESWVVVNGGYYDGDVGITFRSGKRFFVEPDSTANDLSRNATFDQVEAWDILTETSDAQYMACILTGNYQEITGESQLCGPRYALGGETKSCQESNTLKIFDLGQLPAPMRQKAATASANSRDGASVVGFCASFCLGYSHFFLYPLDGPPSSKYACSCWGEIAGKRFGDISFNNPSFLQNIRSRYDPAEFSFSPSNIGRGYVQAMPAFDCLEGASLSIPALGQRQDPWPQGRFQRLAGSRYPRSRELMSGEASILATAFRNTLSEAFWEYDGYKYDYTPFCLDFDEVNPTASGNVPDWGNFDNVDGVGACQDLCTTAKPSSKTVYWIALSGKNCRCGVTLGFGASMKGGIGNCKTFVRDEETGSIINRDFFYYHGTENVYSAIYYNRLTGRWTDMGSDQTSDQSSSGRIASDSGSPLMSQTAITEIGVADGREHSLPGVLEIGEPDRNQTLLAGYDEWDLQALSSGPIAKTWIEVENAICTSRRTLGGCSGQAYTYASSPDLAAYPITVCAAESETCFCDDGWVYAVHESDLDDLGKPTLLSYDFIRLAPNSKIACTEANFYMIGTGAEGVKWACVCQNRLQPIHGSWISQGRSMCQNVRPGGLNTTDPFQDLDGDFVSYGNSLGLAEARKLCLQDAKAECTGLVVYPGRTIYDPPSYYICDAWVCPVTTKSIPSPVKQAVRMPFKRPTVHIALTLPAQQKRSRNQFIEFELPQCAKLHVSDTVRITYMEHALPFFIAFSLIAGGFVLSLMRRPMRVAQASAYGQFVLARDRQQQRRDAEAKEERDAMREGRRLAHDLVRRGDDDGSGDSGAGGIGDGGEILEPYHPPQTLDKLEIIMGDEIPSAAPVALSAGVSADGQFAQMLKEFVCSRDSQYLKQCLASMSLLFQEEPTLGRDPETKSKLIVAAKRKRNEDSSIWTPEVAQEFGATLKGLSLLGRLGITMPNLSMGVGSLAGDVAGNVRSGLARARSMGGRGGNMLSQQQPLAQQAEGVAESGEIGGGGDSV